MATLTSQQLKDSYQSLVTIGDSITSDPTSGALENGKGTALTSFTIGDSHYIGSEPTFDNLLLQSSSGESINISSANDIVLKTNAVNPSGTGTERMKINGSSGDISFRDTSNNEAFYWDASAGSLGIGTTSPISKLYVNAGGDNYAGIFESTDAQALISFKDNNSASALANYVGVITNDLVFGANSAERMRIDSSGNVRLSGTAPSAENTISKIDFYNNSSSINLAGIEGKRTAGGTNYGSLIFNTTNSGTSSEKMRIDSSGSVGIGIATPDSYDSNADNLVIGSTGVNDKNGITIVGGDTDGRGAIYFADTTQNSAGFITYFHSNNSMLIGTSDQTRIALDSSGNLLVGTTATPTSSAGNIVLKNGTAPTGNATDGVILYAEDVSTSSELKVRDEAGNVTTLSPHNFSLIPDGASEPMAWAYYSERDGKKINVDMLKLARMVESLTGEKLVYEQ